MYMYLNDIICVSLICKKNGLFYSGIICDIIILKLQMEVLRFSRLPSAMSDT